MIISRSVTALLAVALACGSGASGASRQEPGQGRQEPSVSDQPPFALTLTVEAREPLRVRAVLRNQSATPQLYLHDDVRQPSELVLRDAAGEPVRPKDRRANRKYDMSVPRDAYRTLPPGESVVLRDDTAVRASDGTYTLEWGPFVLDPLPSGSYRAQVRWESATRDWKEVGGPRRGTVDGVWLGRVESPVIELHLP